jgi:hypothetical protein
MEKDLWICDKDTDIIVNLRGCIKILKDENTNGSFLLKFMYISDVQRTTDISYFKKHHRDNMYEHIMNYLNVNTVDSNKKPLTL